MTPVPRVVAVVLHWRREEETRACLRALLASDHPALHVLVVDNGSEDGSGERIRREFPQVEHLRSEVNLGYTGGNNLGWRHALERRDCDHLLFVNDDAEVEEGAVSALVARAEAGKAVGAVAPKILERERPDRIWFGGGRFSRLRATGIHVGEGAADGSHEDGAREVTFVTGCCLLVPARVMEDVGGFEEDFFAYVEDVDLSLRLRRAGYHLWYEPAARVRHAVAPEEPSPRQIELRDRNRRRLVRRRYGWGAAMAFATFFYPSRLVHLARYLARGDRARAGGIWRGMTAP